ncbi:hypothetical protein NLM27_10495 [Bradyrhizobium sp. CCGB12]|uniref:hypothetical protein n=1 Tax=Bradyrhizobium sp. CCGB12 TaxID=2949632 RepID=UPI0020B302E2|nr:hypothetical protein [Bradyrhizobium sp. CCGB12]MCP3389204.1 hypothetical protein [Bradyrhizobium sp. CCGB12]
MAALPWAGEGCAHRLLAAVSASFQVYGVIARHRPGDPSPPQLLGGSRLPLEYWVTHRPPSLKFRRSKIASPGEALA